MNTEAELQSIVEDIARAIGEDQDVAAGLLMMEAGRVAAGHGLPREDIAEYAIDYALGFPQSWASPRSDTTSFESERI